MERSRKITRRDFIKWSGLSATALLTPLGSDKKFETSDPVFLHFPGNSLLNSHSNQETILFEEKKIFENGQIGIEQSTFLSGIIDLKYKDKETGEWVLYNNIIPEVTVKRNPNHAEMFGSKTTMQLISNTPEMQEIEIQYEKMQGRKKVGKHVFQGNGAHFKLIATIPSNKPEITFRVVQHDDSTPIDSVSLGNYFGAAQRVRYLEVNNEIIDTLTTYPTPRDGNFEIGDFYQFDAPNDGKVRFWSDGSNFIQTQSVGNVKDPITLEIEKRANPWRPEQSSQDHPYNPEKPWLEMVRITQPYSPDKTWTFGYDLGE